MKETIQKTREYLDYIEKHYDNVQKAWEEIKERCKHLEILKDKGYIDLLNEEIKNHDLSKLSEEEFVEYREVFYPTSKEKNRSLSSAWIYHVQFNPHHWENWTKIEEYGFVDKNIKYLHCLHMLVDWLAMSYVRGGSPKEYYEKNKDKISIPEEYVKFMYEVFECLEKT